MNKLSEDLQRLSEHVENAEKKVAAAEQQSKEKVEASLKKSREDAKARQESFKATVKAKQANAALQWEELQANHNKKVQEIKNKIETEKEAREVKKAQKRADDTASYAAAAIMYVYLAIDEAEVAVLEAIDAQAYADSLA